MCHYCLKGHGHDVRVWIFLRICIINLDHDGVVFKPRRVQCTHTFDHAYQIYGLTSVCGNIVTMALQYTEQCTDYFTDVSQ